MFKRLITRRLHRAFAELDRFDDAMAMAFVAAAARSWRRWLARWMLAASSFLLLWLIWAIAGRLMAWPVTWLMDRLWVTAPILVLVLGVSFVLAMRTRDWCLRRSIRGLIRRRGTCARCGYLLLGMPLPDDPHDLRLTCPECGEVTTADASMCELVADADGRRVYKPSLAVLSPEHLALQRRRRRRLVKFAMIALAIVATPLLLTFVGWRAFLGLQASHARADLARISAEIRAEEAAARPADATSIEDWLAIAAEHEVLRVRAFEQVERELAAEGDATALADAQAPGVTLNEFERAGLPYTEGVLAKPGQAAGPAARVRVVDALDQACGRWDEKLDAMLLRPIAFPAVLPHLGSPIRYSASPDAELMWVVRALAARSARHLQRGDMAAFERNLGRLLRLVCMLDTAMYQQSRLHVMYGVKNRIIDDDVDALITAAIVKPRAEDALAAIQRQLRAMPPLPRPADKEAIATRIRQGYELLLAHEFSDASYIENRLLGLEDDARGVLAFEFANAARHRSWFGRMGTYSENLQAVRLAAPRIADEMMKEPAKRAKTWTTPNPSAPSLVIGQWLDWAEQSAGGAGRDQPEAFCRAMIVSIAVERFLLRTGKLPAVLKDLTHEDGIVSAEMLIDPLTGSMMTYTLARAPRDLSISYWGYTIDLGSGAGGPGAYGQTTARITVNP